MEAKWQQNHSEILALENKKNKLKAEIEVFETQRKELTDTLTDLRKCIMADKGDYGTTEYERISKIEEMDSQIAKLTNSLEETESTLKGKIQSCDNLSIKSQALQNQIEKQLKQKAEVDEELDKTNKSLDKLKLVRQEEEEKRRVRLAELIMETKELSKKLDALRQEYETKRIHILAEERRLSIKRSDLEIYEARMRKKYPNETFVLKSNDITSEDKN